MATITADEIRDILRVMYHMGDAAVWDECWRDEDEKLIVEWGTRLNRMNRATLATLKSLANKC